MTVSFSFNLDLFSISIYLETVLPAAKGMYNASIKIAQMKTLRSSANFALTSVVGASLVFGFPGKSLAGRGLGADKEQVNVYAIKSTNTKGLKLVKGWISYNDGDVLSGVFRIYCPTSMIRPTEYTLKDRKGGIKKIGEWWDPSFSAKWEVERQLVRYACSNRDFGAIQ